MVKTLKKHIILLLMSIGVVFMAVYSIATLTQISSAVVINTTSGATNFVEYSLTELSDGSNSKTISTSTSEVIYVNVPLRSNITSSILNITGLSGETLGGVTTGISTTGPYDISINSKGILCLVSGEGGVDGALTTFNISSSNNSITELDKITGSGAPNFLTGVIEMSVFCEDDFAYVVTHMDDALSIFNISNASNIIQVGNISGGYLDAGKDVYVLNDVAYVASFNNHSLITYNITNRSNIIFMDAINLPWARNVKVKNDIAYLLGSFFASFNVTNKSNIQVISNLTLQDASTELYLDSDKDVAYATSTTTLKSINITNTSNMFEMDTVSGLSRVIDLVYFSNNVYITDATSNSLSSYNVTNASNIILRDTISGVGAPNYLDKAWGIDIYNGIIYVASANDNALSSFRFTYPSNVTIDAGNDGDVEFNHSGELDSSNTTIDISNELNSYLSSLTTSDCEVLNERCSLPLNITTNGGDVTIDAINITYDYNTTYLFTRNDTYTWNDTTDLTPNNKLKRRYSIQPTWFNTLVKNRASYNVTISAYYLRNDTASQCEVDNAAKTITSNYCEYSFIVEGNNNNGWPTHYIWDNNITEEVAVNITNSSWLIGSTLYQNITIGYRSPDNTSAATSGLFTNTTFSVYYNTSITDNEKLEYYSGGTWYDITTTNNCDNYERKNVVNRIFYTCLNKTEKYFSIKIETSN